MILNYKTVIIKTTKIIGYTDGSTTAKYDYDNVIDLCSETQRKLIGLRVEYKKSFHTKPSRQIS